MNILECDHVTKRFGLLTALEDLSFTVAKGEVFGIAGPNGAGKTTLFNVITGILPGDGTIRFEDREIQHLPAHRVCRRGIARTFQIPQLFGTLPVRQNVAAGAIFGARGISDRDAHVAEVLAFAGLSGKEETRAAELKLLDKKRTMVATALATRPRLLLLDEPIAGLSPPEIREAVAMFKRINTELGITVIIIEHFMKVLAELAQRLMIIDNGRRVCIDTPQEVSRDQRVIACYLGGTHA